MLNDSAYTRSYIRQILYCIKHNKPAYAMTDYIKNEFIKEAKSMGIHVNVTPIDERPQFANLYYRIEGKK